MPIIKQKCLNCQKDFNARSQDVNRGYGKFCCQSCSSSYNRAHEVKPEPNVECAWCHIRFYKNKSKKKASKSGLYFCGRKCKDQAQSFGGIKEIQLPHVGNGIRCYRNIAFRNKDVKCERCGFDKEAAIIVHHRDRNRDNNHISNLEVLCANCHAIEHWGN
jgi:hypothetical protein